MIKDIFPTRIIVDELSENQVFHFASRFAEHGEKDWELVVDQPTIITDLINKWCDGEYEIVDGWIRSGYSSFDLHCDSHYGNQLVCVVQLYGEEGCGGDLVLYDPSWRNPQWTSDYKQKDVNTETIKFKIGQVIVFPSDVWHKVTEYTGSISRITLNLMIKRVS
jgi:hypothetical protein